jgi:hypothetical protein
MGLRRCLCREVWLGILLLVLGVERMFDVGDMEISVVEERIEDKWWSFDSLHFFSGSSCQGMLPLTNTVLFVLPLTDGLDNPTFVNTPLYQLPSCVWNACSTITPGQIGVSVDPHEDCIDFLLDMQYNIHWLSIVKFSTLNSYIIEVGFTKD